MRSVTARFWSIEAHYTNLDRAPARREAPATQILRYMFAPKHIRMVRYGGVLLTNGVTWRLYYGRARSRSEGFVGINLADLLDPQPLAPIAPPEGAPADHWMRVFLLLFRREAFETVGPPRCDFPRCRHREGRTYEARVTEELSAAVFDRVFPTLVQAFAEHDRNADTTSAGWRAEAREGAIRLLYRLLFLSTPRTETCCRSVIAGYLGYSLRGLRERAAEVADDGEILSARATG